MDDITPNPVPAMPPPAPHRSHHMRAIIIGIIILLAVVSVAYLLYINGYLKWPSGNGSGVNVAWASPVKGGSIWTEEVAGKMVAHPQLSGKTITGIARASGKTYIIGRGGDNSSTIYQFTNNTYTPVYSSQTALSDLSISTDGNTAIFVSKPNLTSASSTVFALTLSNKQLNTIGSGFDPVLVHAGDVNSVLYINGNQIYGSSLNNGSWTEPISLYTSFSDFSPATAIATDGMSQFAFNDSQAHATQLWKITSLNPLTISAVQTYNQSYQGYLSFFGGKFQVLSVSISPTKPVVTAVPLGTTGTSSAVTLIQSVGVPSVITILP